MRIKIDSREQGPRNLLGTRKQRAKHYYRKMRHDPIITTLEYGDYVFNDKVVYEYKSIDDFMSSIFNGSVFEEVANQTSHYDYSFLIIVGSLEKYVLASYYQRGNEYNTLESWRIKSNVAYKGAVRRLRTYCNVILVPDEDSAFEEMLFQSKKCLNLKSYGGSKRGVVTGDVVTDMIIGANKVSFKMTERIIKTLQIKNVGDLMKQTIDDFKTVDKVGDVIATNVYQHIHKGEE